ncbi:MAG: hypothetical protein QM692_24250 [Thermomicrobiales bacterium]
MGNGVWRTISGIAMLAATLTTGVVAPASAQNATPAPSAAATPVVDGVPMVTFAPVESEHGFFEVTLDPGQSTTVSVKLANIGAAPYEMVTFAADVYTRVNGGAESRLRGEPISGATTWIVYPEEALTLQPGETATRDIMITAPADATPGEYTTSIVLQNLNPIDTGTTGGVGMLQVVRQAIAIAITVPGPAEPALAIDGASYMIVPAYAAVLVDVANTGAIRLAPQVEMELTTRDGELVTNGTLQMETFFPQTRTNLEFPLVRTLEPGEYAVTVSLTDEEHGVSAGPVELPLVVEEPAGTPVAETEINISGIEINEARNDAGELQVVEAVVQIDNPGMPASNAQLTLHVYRDGELLEDLVLGSSLNFPTGPAEFRQRYLPLSGWEPGEYTFTVTLESIDPNNNQPVVLDEEEASVAVDVS